MIIAGHTNTPLSEVEGWPVKKWLRVLAHVQVKQDRAKEESLRDAIKFEKLRLGLR